MVITLGQRKIRTRLDVLSIPQCCFQPEKTTLFHGGQSRSWSAEQGKENKKKKSGSIPPPPHPTPHPARSEKIKRIKITRRIYRRYAGLGRSRVRTRISSARRLGQWVWLRKILHSRLRYIASFPKPSSI